MTRQRAIVIGGGILGVSVLLHLARNGWRDVLLMEKSVLTSGATWHSSGDIGFGVDSTLNLWMARYSLGLYRNLDDSAVSRLGWHPTGGLRIAYTEEEVGSFRRYIDTAREFGMVLEVVSPDELRHLHPLFNFDGVVAGLYSPFDGNVDAHGATMVLADAARSSGARILCRTRAASAAVLGNGDWEVTTDDGRKFTCGHLIIAGGSYTRQIGWWFGANLAVYSFLHHYFVTADLPVLQEGTRELPIVRDERCGGYVRQEQNGILIGTSENETATVVWSQGAPWDDDHPLFEPDYDSVAHLLEGAMQRLPVLADARLRTAVRGAVTCTPDGRMLLGRVDGHENLWVAGGASTGIAWGGGAGKCLADLIVHGNAPVSTASLDPNRFAHATDVDLLAQATENFLRRGRISPAPASEHQ